MSESLSAVTSFFQNTSATTDVSGAIMATAWIYKIVTVIIGIIGLAAAAIFLSRIAVDVMLIAGRGIGFVDKMAKFGTAGGDKADSYSSVGAYLKNNVPEIVMTVVLIVFLVTGWIFNLIALVINGLGIFFNKLAGIDVIGTVSALNAQSYVENVPNRDTTDLKKEYDDAIKQARNYYSNIQSLSDVSKDDPKFIEYKNQYTVEMAKAQVLSKELTNRKADVNLKLGSGYFKQHLRGQDDGTTYCRTSFIQSDITSKYGVNVSCSN